MTASDRSSPRATTAFVFLAWFAATLALVRQVVVHGTSIPFLDDAFMASFLRPDREVTWGWIWMHHNEHRIPLARLVYLGAATLAHDLRAGTYVIAALLACASLVCVLAARAVRGRTSWVDAFFPLVWLHGAQSETVLNSFQLAFVLPSMLTTLALACVWTDPRAERTRTWSVLVVVLLLLPVQGVVGLVQTPVWIAWALARGWVDPRRRVLAVAACVASVGIAAAAASGFHTLGGFQAPEVTRLLAVAVQFLAQASGVFARDGWPYSGWITGALLGAGAYVVARRIAARGDEAWRAFGLACVVVSVVALAGSIGYGRGSDGPLAGTLERYGVLAAPAWCALAALATTRAAGRLEHVLSVVLVLVSAAAFVPNFAAGERAGAERAAAARALADDLDDGESIERVAETHWRVFLYSPELFADVLRDLQAARLAPFDREPAPVSPVFEGTLRSQPVRVPAPADAVVRRAGDRSVLLLRHGVGLEFATSDRPRNARGSFGVHPAFAEREDCPPVSFRVVVVRPDGAREIRFERVLDVRRTAEDRGQHEFRLALSPTDAGSLVRIEAEPVGAVRPPFAASWVDVYVR